MGNRPWTRILVTAVAAAALSVATATQAVAAPPPPDLEPLTDEQWAAHVEEVNDKVGEAMADGLATDVTYTLNGDGVHWLPERVAEQRETAAELYARGDLVPNDGDALFTGGLPGAGKTTALNQNPDVDPSQYLVLNADDAKDKLCEHDMIPEIEGIAPLEGADLIQKESSRIA